MRAGVGGEDILAALRVIKLARAGMCERVVVGDLAEVDGGLCNFQRAGWRQVADHVIGQAFTHHGVDGAGG